MSIMLLDLELKKLYTLYHYFLEKAMHALIPLQTDMTLLYAKKRNTYHAYEMEW